MRRSDDTIRNERPQGYDFTEPQLSRLGHRLPGSGNTAEAFEILLPNVEQYPRSLNVYDSLGEACATAGDPRRAIENYRRSVELNPDNANGVERLRKLGADPR